MHAYIHTLSFAVKGERLYSILYQNFTVHQYRGLFLKKIK